MLLVLPKYAHNSYGQELLHKEMSPVFQQLQQKEKALRLRQVKPAETKD